MADSSRFLTGREKVVPSCTNMHQYALDTTTRALRAPQWVATRGEAHSHIWKMCQEVRARRRRRGGNVFKRVRVLPSGRVKHDWVMRVSLGADGNGRRVRRWFSARTKSEVLARVTQVAAEHDGFVPQTLRLEQFVDAWLSNDPEFHQLRPISATTRRSYRLRLARILPSLGPKRLHNIRASHVTCTYDQFRARGIAEASLRRIHYALYRALNVAVIMGLVAKNEARYCYLHDHR